MVSLAFLERLVAMLALLATGRVELGTVFGSSSWDPANPHSRLACYHREINDKTDFVVAHNVLPCRARLWIFNPRTGRSVIATVGDRGPRHADIDLSKQVAKRLKHNGHEHVLVMQLSKGAPLPTRRAALSAHGSTRLAEADEAPPQD